MTPNVVIYLAYSLGGERFRSRQAEAIDARTGEAGRFTKLQTLNANDNFAALPLAA